MLQQIPEEIMREIRAMLVKERVRMDAAPIDERNLPYAHPIQKGGAK